MFTPRHHTTLEPPGARRDHAPSLDASARIGVIGAGPAGLSAARFLVQKGFRNVTVLEREGRVGGKCSTVTVDGRSYELGALILTPHYTSVRSLMRELGLKATANDGEVFPRFNWRRAAVLPAFLLDVDGHPPTFVPPVLREAPWGRVAASMARLARELIRYRDLNTPGLAGMPPETFVPFGQWAKERGLTEASSLIVDALLTPQGYGYMNDVPAAYVLKYMTLFYLPRLYELHDGGYQGLWETVARDLDVRLGVSVQRVRRGEQVVVETDRESFTFDALVLTSPLDEALSFLDATSEEEELASKIAYIDYRVVIASASGLPKYRYVTLPRRFVPDARGEVLLWHKRWEARDEYTFYAYGREGTSMDETVERLSETVRRVGGAVTKVHHTQRWKYFPHVSCQDLADGYFERFEQLQGARRTYYAGELLAFGTVETVVRHTRDLVERHFATARPDARTGSLAADRSRVSVGAAPP